LAQYNTGVTASRFLSGTPSEYCDKENETVNTRQKGDKREGKIEMKCESEGGMIQGNLQRTVGRWKDEENKQR
jgi:hypothetical protein